MFELSIIIPVKAGDDCWKKLVKSLRNEIQCEILIIGPEFQDSIDGQFQYVHVSGNRAEKLNCGAIKARSSNLIFLHADSALPSYFVKTILYSLDKFPDKLHHFDLEFDSSGIMRLNTYFANLRSHIFKMPFGDQAFFMTKKIFYTLGFFNTKVSYGEDHLLVWKAHQIGISLRSTGIKIITSARKYEETGWLKTTARHIFLTYKQALPELLKVIKKKKSTSAFAIFVKTPGFSEIKTRLAQSIGKESAEDFFKFSLAATEEYVLHALKDSQGKMSVYWAVCEEGAQLHPLWTNFPVIIQGNGSLGEKLYQVQNVLLKKHEYVFMIGADSPQLNFKILLQALTAKEHANHIIGQTEDGGFYLYGGNIAMDKEFWTSIHYSCETTSKELMEKAGASKFIELEKNFDIDTIFDLKKLANLPTQNLLPKQKAIVQWAKENF